MTRLTTWDQSKKDAPASLSGGIAEVTRNGIECFEIDSGDLTGSTHRANWSPGGVNNRNYFLAIYIWLSANPASVVLLDLLGNATGGFHGQLRLNTNGTLNLLRNTSNVVGSASSALSIEAWNRLDLRVLLGTATNNGQVEARLAGSSFASASGVNLGAGEALADMRIGQNSNSGGAGGVTIRFANIALNDDQGGSDNTWAADNFPTSSSGPRRGSLSLLGVGR